jgi:hypothetical protein
MKTSKQLAVGILLLTGICFLIAPAWGQSEKNEKQQAGECDRHVYVNGQFDGVINTGSPIPNSFDLWIGSSPFGANTNWRGSIDEVRIWAVARTQEQIQSTMNQYLCGDERGLRAILVL